MMKRLPYLIFSLGMAMTLNAAGAFSEIEDQNNLKILTPSLQNRETAKIRLENGLEALLISDPEATQSSAALAVEAGSWHESPSDQGIAHFLEHMLFLGTTKYPEEGEYHRFIKENGGIANAYTASTITNYQFSIHHEHFEEALDRFSYFFKEPLFNPSGVNRELNAVDQEFKKAFNSDMARSWMVLKELANKEHPFSYFHFGSLESLAHTKTDQLKEWFKNHYSAEKMHVVLYSNASIATLKELAASHFSQIEKRKTKSYTFPEKAFTEKVLGGWTYIQPVKDVRNLSIYWELPRGGDNFEAKDAGTLLGQVVGHEGETSLLALLKEEGLAETLSAGYYDFEKDQPMFMLSIKLTEKGMDEKETVLTHLFQLIEYLKKNPISTRQFNEVNKLAYIDYQYQSRQDPFEYATASAAGLVEEPIETYPQKTVTLTALNKELLDRFLHAMTPKNGIFILQVDQNVGKWTAKQEEKWMRVPYKVEKFSKTFLDQLEKPALHPSLALPEANPFIPTELELKNVERAAKAYPNVASLQKNDEAVIYFAQDRFYQVPEGIVYFHIKLPQLSEISIKNRVLAEIYLKSVNDKLNAFSYPAQLAGLSYGLSVTDEGFKVVVSGYDEKCEVLLKKVIETLKEGMPSLEKFQVYKKSLTKKYHNFSKELAFYQGFEMKKKALQKEFILQKEKGRVIGDVSLEDLQEFYDGLFKTRFFEGFFYGNFSEKQANALTALVKADFPGAVFKEEKHLKKELLILPNDHPYFLSFDIPEGGNAALLTIQNGGFSHKNRAAVEVFENTVKKAFFDALRTKQQTGYIVFNQSEHIENQLFSWFGVQSATHDPRDLLARFELFIEEFIQSLQDREQAIAQFERVRDSMIKTLEKPPENLKEMGTLLVSIAFDRDAAFDWMEKRLEGFKNLTFEEYVAFVESNFSKANRKRLGILVQEEKEEGGQFRYAPIRTLNDLIEKGNYTSKPKEVQALLEKGERVR